MHKWTRSFPNFLSKATLIFKAQKNAFQMIPLKVLGKSVGLCKTTKRKDQLYISLLVSVTPSDNSFTISPHNLALSHSTLLHSYPVPLKWVCASSNMCTDIFLEDIKKSTSYFSLFFLHFISFNSKYFYSVSVLIDNILQFLFRNSSFIHVCVSFKKCIKWNN